MTNNEQKGTRHLIRRDGQKCYIWISDTDLMFFPPNDAGIANQEVYSAVNAICRMASMLRGSGREWADIVRQLDGANITGNKTWCRDIAQLIRDEFFGVVETRSSLLKI